MERSFKKEVQALKLGDGETFRGEGILAVTKALLQSGVSYVGGYQGAPGLASARCAGGRRGHHVRPRRAPGNLFERSVRCRDARRLDQLSAARRGDLEIDRRHQCRRRRPVEPRLTRRDRRRDDHPRRRLRRRRERHPGTLLRLRAQIIDVAARPAARTVLDRAHGGKGLRAFRSEPCAGDAGTAHPRLSRHRRIRREEQSQGCRLGPRQARRARRASNTDGWRIRR